MTLNRFPLLKTIFCLVLVAITITTITGLKPAPQPGAYLQLQDQHIALSSKEFYIASVIDERSNPGIIGKLVQAGGMPAKAPEVVSASIKGGSAALKNYLIRGLPSNKNLRAVTLRIKAIDLAEKPVANGMAQGSIRVALDFGLIYDDEFTRLDSYEAESTYQRKAGGAQQAEPLLRTALDNSLIYINKWIDSQANNNIALAKAVKISFSNYTENTEGDTIYYNIDRPLKWADFKDRPRNNKYGAEVFASLGYNEDVKLVKGIFQIKIDLKIYAAKSACWAKPEAMDDYGLNHEQRHFDIVKIVAEHFRQNLLNIKYDPRNYDGPINVAYLDALREIDSLQKQYDGETAHSRNTWQQEQWNNRIDKELQQLGIKPVTAQAAFK
ncbi:hypothetical protein DYU05_16055 [Mucilaginibacter terrenus]|uniref:DUF922 domain-containing protein n=1 Tax=Mucilaginibacter terrenus TaxID=2482727 RepID=A0A3E2NMG0_9SPHI|nr:hypothetical protein [Mucilaginibacter terrenus]RFZ82133.1 hypothetical protein DYU05_16055 [Mucilaginibacter terrenus]